MNKRLLFCLLALWLLPLMGMAQDDNDVALQDYVEEYNALCPIDYGDKWGINSLTMVGMSYVLADMKLPENLSMFLSSFASDEDRVKQMWIGQFAQYGDRWNHMIDLIAESGCRLVINLRPSGSAKTALITLLPTDFKR